MGEYWKPVNVTKREYVHPHRVGDGLKMGEWNHSGSATCRRVAELIRSGQWDKDDDIRIASDYDNEEPWDRSREALPLVDVGERGNLYYLASEEYRDVSEGGTP